MQVEIDKFGTAHTGELVEKYTLDNEQGVTVELITFGATVLRIKTPDCTGKRDDITVGFDTLEEYLTKNHHFGSIAGRYANRIAGANFMLDGTRYHLEANNGANHIHGGSRALDKYVWSAHAVQHEQSASVIMQHISPAGDMGYPGTLAIHVAYTLDSTDSLTIDYAAFTDAPTVLNLTNHTYFNISGNMNDPAYDHMLTVHADEFLPVDESGIPLAHSPVPVEGTAMNLLTPVQLGTFLAQHDEQLENAGGLDHTYVLSKDNDRILRLAATLTHPLSGRSINVATTEPGVQVYTANGLDGTTIFRNGAAVPKHGAIAFEAQHFPNSPNRPDFPSTVLTPGKVYTQKTRYTFNKVLTSCEIPTT